MRLREHEAIQDGKLDMFRADPRKLVVQDNYNVRDLTTPEAVEKLRELAASIAEIGVTDPLMVRFDGQRIVVVQGHRRLAATLIAIEGGADIKSVPIYQEARSANDATRDLDLIISNAGEPLTQLEKATIVGRLVAHGWSHADIAKKCGWKSTNTVTGLLDMLALPEAVKTQVRDREVSPSLAVKIMKEQPDHVAELIKANVEENKRLGVGAKMKHKATPKTINRDRPKQPPQPPPEQARTLTQEEERAVLGGIRAGTELIEELPLSPLSPLSPQGVAEPAQEATPPVVHPAPVAQLPSQIAAERQRGLIANAALARRQAFSELIAALEPFAKLAHEHDFDELSDESVIEVPLKHLKKAWVVFAAVCGNGDDPFARLDAAVEETKALVEGADA